MSEQRRFVYVVAQRSRLGDGVCYYQKISRYSKPNGWSKRLTLATRFESQSEAFAVADNLKFNKPTVFEIFIKGNGKINPKSGMRRVAS